MRKTHLLSILVPLSVAVLGCGDTGTRIMAPEGPARFNLGATVRVAVSCPSSIETGSTAQCSATGYDSANNVTGTTVSSWATSDANKVSVTSGGQVGGVNTGSAEISATMSGVIGSGTVVVVPDED